MMHFNEVQFVAVLPPRSKYEEYETVVYVTVINC